MPAAKTHVAWRQSPLRLGKHRYSGRRLAVVVVQTTHSHPLAWEASLHRRQLVKATLQRSRPALGLVGATVLVNKELVKAKVAMMAERLGSSSSSRPDTCLPGAFAFACAVCTASASCAIIH